MKYTARMRKTKPSKWFHFSSSFLKKMSVNATKTTNVIASWITFNSTRLKGPPFSRKPNLFAGTWKKYSKSAIPQLIKTTEMSPRFSNHFISLNLRCPYQAKVINVFDKISRTMVQSPLIRFSRFFPKLRVISKKTFFF